MKICGHLQYILDNEIKSGNEVKQVFKDSFERCELLIILKRRFSKEYEKEKLPKDVKMHIDNDPHYPIGKGYYCIKHKHDIFAEK
jgi:hypothetical protein